MGSSAATYKLMELHCNSKVPPVRCNDTSTSFEFDFEFDRQVSVASTVRSI